MISVEEATSIILSRLCKPETETIEIVQSAGRILADCVIADRDLPPFHRVSMDGIAIRFDDYKKGARTFVIQDIQAAGQPRLKLTLHDSCIEVMTGAMLPEGTDTVIRYEDVGVKEKIATVLVNDLLKGQNIHFQAMDAKHNELLLSEGIKISAAEVALLASVGQSRVKVYTLPKIAIISTGNELVSIDEVPLSHQIRRSNAYALQAALLDLGFEAIQFHLPDEKKGLEKSLREIFSHHKVIILSGGVSKGKFDFVPEVLESLGVKKLFHQVGQKPGKPFWFGNSASHTVFALPGNPVSTYLCFYRFIKPWLLKSCGAEYKNSTAILAKDFSFKPMLTYFLQVKTEIESGKLIAYPSPGGGSGDFANLKNVNGFLELPSSISSFKAGDIYPFIPFRGI